jgi:uncharacterized protein (TIGR03435 family)
MCVESMFWFFPPVWWIGAKLMEERERDCDEAALAQGGCPGEYARSILQVCGRYVGSLLPCAAGISGADLKTRVAKIMTWRKPLPVTLRAKIGLAMAATMAVLVPLGIGMARGQSEQVSAFRVQAVPTLKFDAATIKPTPVDAQGRPLSGNTYSYFRGNRANLSCNVRAAIAVAYNAQPYQVNYPKEDAELMRSWYDIVGVPTGPATAEQLRTMLQALFADRFKLVVQYEMRSTPGYALVVAKGGPKNLNPMQPIDPEHPSASDRGLTITQLAGRLYLNDQGYWVGPNINGAIPVDDETAIKGSYDLWPGPFGRAGFSPAAAPPQEEIGNDQESLADLLNEKLGLTLVKKTVSRAYITVTHIAPPSPN